MNFLKDMIIRKYEDYFISLKNNKFNPNLFYEAISLINAYYNVFTDDDIEIRNTLLYAYNWQIFEEVISSENLKDIELKTDFNIAVKNNFSYASITCVEMINQQIREDQNLLNRFYNEFREQIKERRRMVSLPDIKQNWSLGIVKDYV